MTLAAIGTIAARVVAAAAQLVLVALAAHALGLSGVGRMSLLLLAVTVIMIACNAVGGGALVYLEPRHGTRTLRRIGYAWAVAVCLAAYPVVEALRLAPDGLAGHACGLAFTEAVASIHLTLLLGRERYGLHNAVVVLRALITVSAFAVLIRLDGAEVLDYALALYAGQGAAAAAGGLALARLPARTSDTWAAIAALIRQGLPAQLANGLQLLNYRLSYYLMDRFQGASALGLWSITNQLAESGWLAPKSLGTVLYARVSNLAERDRQRDTTLAVLKVSVVLAAAAALLLLALPEAVFLWAFGGEARGIRGLVVVLLPGLLAMAASQALSHYLSGTGRVAHNTVASGIGVAATLGLGAWLIPLHGAPGAAGTASIAYGASVLYQAVVFNRCAGAHFAQYLPSSKDAGQLAVLVRRLLGR